MPGLVRGIARTAVVAGTATATRNAVNRRQAKKNVESYSEASEEVYAEHPPPQKQVQAPPPTSQDDEISQLERLGALHAQGILTDEEFAAQKAKILSI